jgi:hypothetical protein
VVDDDPSLVSFVHSMIDRWFNVMFGVVHELFLPGSNLQAAISMIDDISSLDCETFTSYAEGYFFPSTGMEILGDTFRKFLI